MASGFAATVLLRVGFGCRGCLLPRVRARTGACPVPRLRPPRGPEVGPRRQPWEAPQGQTRPPRPGEEVPCLPWAGLGETWIRGVSSRRPRRSRMTSSVLSWRSPLGERTTGTSRARVSTCLSRFRTPRTSGCSLVRSWLRPGTTGLRTPTRRSSAGALAARPGSGSRCASTERVGTPSSEEERLPVARERSMLARRNADTNDTGLGEQL